MNGNKITGQKMEPITIADFLTALGLALVLEGIPYTLFPDRLKNILQQVIAMPPEALRTMGMVLLFIGVATIYFVRM